MDTFNYTRVSLNKRKGYYDVFIYYSKNAKKFRPPTGVSIDEKHITKKGEISKGHPNYEEDMLRISKMRTRVENLIVKYVERYNEKPSKEWLEEEYDKPYVDARKDLQDVLCYWPEFLAHKKNRTRGNRTLGRLNNMKHTIERYRQARNLKIEFVHLRQEFFNDLVTYMADEHLHDKAKKKDSIISQTQLPVKGLNNDVIIKRLKDFVDYLNWVKKAFNVDLLMENIEDYVTVAKHIKQVRPLSGNQKWELVLSPDEMQFIINLDYYEPDYWNSLSKNSKRYLMIAIFMGLQGTSPVDAQDIKRIDISDHRIIKDRSKSGLEFNVELDPVSEDILEIYDFDLRFVEQSMNKSLKRLFVTIFELYRKHYEEKLSKPYKMIHIQRVKKGARQEYRMEHRGMYVECLTFRRTCLDAVAKGYVVTHLKDAAILAGHSPNRPKTTRGYLYDNQNHTERKSLFGVYRILPWGDMGRQRAS